MNERADGWDPQQYERFAAERAQPFHDLMGLIEGRNHERVVDLGCGTGALTVELHRHLGAGATVGVDNSPAMLEKAQALAADGVRFEFADIATYADDSGGDDRGFDVVFTNAALQWLPDHPSLLARVAGLVRAGGQLAVQVPANADHATHLVAAEVALEEPFLSAFDGPPPPDPVATAVLPPAEYAVLLHRLGFAKQHVRLQVYGHTLDSAADTVEWVKGTMLTRFKRALPDDLYDRFVDRYRTRLLEVLDDSSPYFYPFKRILFWARKPVL